MLRAGFLVLSVAVIFIAVPSRARADVLSFRTVEYGPWARSVASLQSDAGTEGSTLHVQLVDSAGQTLPCDSYSLAFDPAGADAFALGSCDETNTSHEIRLVSRDALFTHGDDIPMPRAITIQAVQQRTVTATGGARSITSTETICSVAVVPYRTDLEHATRVALDPRRFELHPLDTAVAAIVTGDGWLLRTPSGGSLAVEYEIIDRSDGSVVLHDRTTLRCDSAPARPGTIEEANAPSATQPRELVNASPAVRQRTVLAGMMISGAGAALIVTGGVFLVEAASESVSGRMVSSSRDSTIGAVALAGGIAVISTGVAIALLAPHRVPASPQARMARVTPAAIGIAPVPGGGMLGAAFVF